MPSEFSGEAHHARASRNLGCRSSCGRIRSEAVFFPAPPAEAEMVQTLNVSQMFLGKNIPEQKLHDMSFVFSAGN